MSRKIKCAEKVPRDTETRNGLTLNRVRYNYILLRKKQLHLHGM